jgi:DNA-directed RNA polymerase specialized sigma24 family protein
MQNNSRRIYKKKVKQFNEVSLIENYHSSLFVDFEAKEEARDILMSVLDKNPELHDILIKKYYYGMTNKEIGEANGYGKEAARKKLKKAIELCRQIVYTNVGTGT